MFSSSQTFSSVLPVPVAVFEYPSIDSELVSLPKIEASAEDPVDLALGITIAEEALAARLSQARAEAVQQTETRLRKEFEGRDLDRVKEAVCAFDRERSDYFSRIEVEVVQLALSIARKILHRETLVDPMLVGALVKASLAQLKEGSSVTIRTRPEEAERWKEYFANGSGPSLRVTVAEDAELEPGACMLETELGSANFSLDAQLKEVEQGFFDVLAQRP